MTDFHTRTAVSSAVASSLTDPRRAALRQAGSRLFFDGFCNLFGALGLDTAAKNLRRYRSAVGGTQAYSDQEIEEHPLVTEAEDANRTRFVAETLTGRAENGNNKRGLLNLKDGQTFILTDFWKSVADFGNTWDKMRHPNTFRAFGSFDVRSTGDLIVRRKAIDSM